MNPILESNSNLLPLNRKIKCVKEQWGSHDSKILTYGISQVKLTQQEKMGESSAEYHTDFKAQEEAHTQHNNLEKGTAGKRPIPTSIQ